MAQSGSLGAGELAKTGQGTWYLYYPGGSTLYPLIRGGDCSGGDVGVDGDISILSEREEEKCLRHI